MLKWIKNSKGAVNNNSTKYKGITVDANGMYKAVLCIRLSKGKGKPKELKNIYIGTYESVKEAKANRIEYILNLL